MNNALGSGANAGSLRLRNYSDIIGVDFSDRQDEIKSYRSPDLVNMWKNYHTMGKGIETRPGLKKVKAEVPVNMIKFYKDGNNYEVLHVGNKLIVNGNTIDSNMENESVFFIYQKTLYILDGKRYLQFNGTLSEVEGYIPRTSIGRKPDGSGTSFEDVNLLTGLRKNEFAGDDESTVYQLDTQNIDSSYTPIVTINGTITNLFSVNYTKGQITFNTAPASPDTVGSDNVIIQFKKEISGYRNRIQKCKGIALFDNRVFFYGNKDYPNMFWHCSLNNPAYVSDLDYYEEGVDDSLIKVMIPGNNNLWVIKESNQNNTSIFYHTPTTDSEYGKLYPNSHSSITTGCVSTGINFGDDIVFFSNNGLEGLVTSDVTKESILAHRSSYVDSKLLNETNYKNVIITEYQNYLLVCIDNRIYLADGRRKTELNGHYEYEWFYWEVEAKIKMAKVIDDKLYISLENKGLFLLSDNSEEEIESYFTTIEDEFDYPQMQKILNKRGFVVDLNGERIDFYIKVDKEKFEKFATYKLKGKDYIVVKAKKKKWKSIQFKFKSNKPFKFYSCTTEAYVGGYKKR